MGLTATQEQFSQILAQQTGLDLNVVRGWVNAEVGGTDGNGWGNFNYLNISTQKGGFPSVQAAADEATRWITTMSNYAGIRQAITTGNPQAELQAIWQSPWDAGHYGGSGQNLVNSYHSVGGTSAPAATAPYGPGIATQSQPVSTTAAPAAAPQSGMTFAQALDTWYKTIGRYPTTLAGAEASMNAPSQAWLASWLQQHANDTGPGQVGTGPTTFPDWAIQQLASQVGADAAYLTIPELAPIIVDAVANGKDPAELQAAVENTDYWKQTTATALAWQTMSPADQQATIQKLQVTLADQYQAEYGTQPPLSQFLNDATQIASGKETQDYWNFNTKLAAEGQAGTPAANSILSAQKQVGAETTAVSNLTNTLQTDWQTWLGNSLQPPSSGPNSLADWANKINMNQASQADFDNYLKTYSQGVYPNKPVNLPYQQWVSQPKSVIGSTLEIDPTSVSDNDLLLQSYLTGKYQNLGDLKLAAQQDPRFDKTQTAVTAARQVGTQLLSTWGFGQGSGL